MQDEGRLVVPPAFILYCALTGVPGSLMVRKGGFETRPYMASARATVRCQNRAPEGISPSVRLPCTSRQVSEREDGYLSPGSRLNLGDYIRRTGNVNGVRSP